MPSEVGALGSRAFSSLLATLRPASDPAAQFHRRWPLCSSSTRTSSASGLPWGWKNVVPRQADRRPVPGGAVAGRGGATAPSSCPPRMGGRPKPDSTARACVCSECLSLRIKDLDFDRNEHLHPRTPRAPKDLAARCCRRSLGATPLPAGPRGKRSPRTPADLEQGYGRTVTACPSRSRANTAPASPVTRGGSFLFPSASRQQHRSVGRALEALPAIHEKVLQPRCAAGPSPRRDSKSRAKAATPLRHSFATPTCWKAAATSVRFQELLGHKDLCRPPALHARAQNRGRGSRVAQPAGSRAVAGSHQFHGLLGSVRHGPAPSEARKDSPPAPALEARALRVSMCRRVVDSTAVRAGRPRCWRSSADDDQQHAHVRATVDG
jgi:hypothetical protein